MAESCFEGSSSIVIIDSDQVSHQFVPACRDWLKMRNISIRILFLLTAMAVFASPLIAIADDFCRCPQCARGTCLVKSEHCPGVFPSEESRPCCGQDEAVSSTPCTNHNPVSDSSPAEPDHKSQTKSDGCHCSIYVCYDGNAIMPTSSSVLSLTTDELYQRIPKTFVTSGWVCQILHPPR